MPVTRRKKLIHIALLKWAVSRCHTAVVLFQKPPTTLEGFFIWCKMNTTNLSKIDLTSMQDGELKETIRQFPYPSQWSDGAAFDYALSRLTHMNGARYANSGDKKVFTTSLR